MTASPQPGNAEAVQHEWLRRVQAEYRSALLAQNLTLWLMQLVAPLELVRAGLSIVEDELSHSEASREVYVAAGGTDPADFGGALEVRLPPRDQLLHAVVGAAVESFCLGETVAVRLFLRLRAGCTQPVARAALDRIVKDEVRHKEFGWTLLEWLLSTSEANAVRVRIERTLPAMFERLRRNYAYSELRRSAPVEPERAAWGLMPPSHYAEVLGETLERDYVPLFSDFDIDARAAWQPS
jgi:hypothetical protein